MSLTTDAAGLSEDHELDQYVQSFTASSDRVRHLIVISAVASVLVFAAYRNSLPGNWWNTRLDKARVAVRNEVWRDPVRRLETCRKSGPQAAEFHESCDEVQETLAWFDKTTHGKVSLEAHLEELEKARVNDLLMVSVPFLGIRFDINDLGAFSAIGLAIICFTLCFAMARQHENLYLSLWRVRRIADREGRYDDGQSKANFLYHALAMAQVFTRPPTLARWRPRGIGRVAIRALLFLPVLVQSLLVISNVRTIESALILNRRATIFSMALQVPLLFVILVSIVASCYYSRAGDLRWNETFFAINPGLRHLKGSSWLEWMKIAEPPQWLFAADAQGNIVFGNPVNSFARQKDDWAVWILQDDSRVKRVNDPSVLPAMLLKQVDANDNEYRFQPANEDRSCTVLVRIAPDGAVERIAGGKRQIADGQGSEAGFSTIRSLILDSQQNLYAIDGPCVRRVSPDGIVTTLGGNPLGYFQRSRWPRLQGLALEGDQLLVADYDYGCVRKMTCDGSRLGIRWRSRGSWSPAGVLVASDTLYVLEQRRPRIGAILLGAVACSARIQQVPGSGGAGTPTVVFEVWS